MIRLRATARGRFCMWMFVVSLALFALPLAAQDASPDQSEAIAQDLAALARVEALLQDPARLDALRSTVAGLAPTAAPRDDGGGIDAWLPQADGIAARWSGLFRDLGNLRDNLGLWLADPARSEPWALQAAQIGAAWLVLAAVLVLGWLGLAGARARLARDAQAAPRRARRLRLALGYVLVAFTPLAAALVILLTWPVWQPLDRAALVTVAALSLPLLAAAAAMATVSSAFTLLAVAGRQTDRATTRRLVPQLGLVAGLQIATTLLRTPGAAGLLGPWLAAATVVMLDALTAFVLVRAIGQQRHSLRQLLQHTSATPEDDQPTIVERLMTWLADHWHIAGYALVALGVLARYGAFGGDSRFGFWADVGLFLALCATVFIAIAWVERLHGRLLARLHRRTGPSLRNELALRVGRVLRASVQVVLLLALPAGAGWLWRVELLDWTGSATGRAALGSILAIPLVAFTLWALWSLLDTLLAWSLGRATADTGGTRAIRLRTLLPLLRNLLFVTVVTLGAISVLSNLGIDVAPLLAGAGVVGLAVGFGAQKLVSDVITGMFLIVEDSMAIGETVEAAGKVGVVEGLTIRTLRLREFDGSLHSIPFSNITTLRNASRGFASYTVTVTILRAADVDRALAEIARIGAEIADDPAWKPVILDSFALWGVDQVTPSGVVIKGAIRTQPNAQWGVGRELNRRIAEGLSGLGIPLVLQPVLSRHPDAT